MKDKTLEEGVAELFDQLALDIDVECSVGNHLGAGKIVIKKFTRLKYWQEVWNIKKELWYLIITWIISLYLGKAKYS